MQASPEVVKWIGIGVASLFGLKVAVLGVQMVVQSLVGAFWMFNGALAAGIWVYGAAVRGIAGLTRVFGVLRMALPMGVRGIALMSRALLANPIGIAGAAIAGAAYLIWRNWEPVSAWFQRLWGNIRDVFGGFVQFIRGIFSGDMSGAVDGLQRMWDGLKGYYQTLWDGIAGIFRAVWENVIGPITDALGITDSIVADWNIAKEAVSAALDALSAKFAAVWAVISPVIGGLKWVRDKGGEALNSVTGGNKGPISSGYNPAADAGNDVIAPPIPQYANGGSFAPVLNDLSARAAALAGLVMDDELAVAEPASPAIAASAGGARQISYEPHYNIAINGSGLDATQLRAAIRAEMEAAGRRAQADLRRLLHD